MMLEVQSLIDRYLNWVRDKTALRQMGDVVEITTPSLDRHNDYIQIYVKKDGNNFILTDDSYTIIDLEQSGCSLDSPRRQQLLKLTLAGFGIQNTDQELFVHATAENFPYKKHNLIQAICAVNDLFFLARPHVEGGKMTEIHFRLIAFGLLAIVFSVGAGFSLARRDYVDVFIFLATSNVALLMALVEVRKL